MTENQNKFTLKDLNIAMHDRSLMKSLNQIYKLYTRERLSKCMMQSQIVLCELI